MSSCMAFFKRRFSWLSLRVLFILNILPMSVNFARLSMVSNRLLRPGFSSLAHLSCNLASRRVGLSLHFCIQTLFSDDGSFVVCGWYCAHREQIVSTLLLCLHSWHRVWDQESWPSSLLSRAWGFFFAFRTTSIPDSIYYGSFALQLYGWAQTVQYPLECQVTTFYPRGCPTIKFHWVSPPGWNSPVSNS